MRKPLLPLRSGGPVSGVGSKNGGVSLGGLLRERVFGSETLWICVMMFTEAERPLERHRDASGYYLLADNGMRSQTACRLLLEHITRGKRGETRDLQALLDIALEEKGKESV